ncbi:MAG: serine/threonine-protein kinase, partial [Candidatus Margulisbacteria bacterium]|nr:serine/threonine-protein kinase [Candidatus Margulisiibacteriota bacterium]
LKSLREKSGSSNITSALDNLSTRLELRLSQISQYTGKDGKKYYQTEVIYTRDGGQSRVVKAQDAEGQFFAVKILAGGDQARFEREIDLLTNIDHPAVIKVLDYGRTQDGKPFFVMPFIEGSVSAENALKKPFIVYDSDPTFYSIDLKPNTSEALARLFIIANDIVDGLSALAAQHTCHRDVKPSNILLRRITDSGARDVLQAVLIDLGVAKRVGEESEGTVSGATIGTFSYLDPAYHALYGQYHTDAERAAASASLILCDIYSLGVTLYRLFCAKSDDSSHKSTFPFNGTITDQQSYLQYADNRSANPLDLAPFAAIPGVGNLIGRMLDPDPTKRPQSMQEVKAELIHLQGERYNAFKGQKVPRTEAEIYSTDSAGEGITGELVSVDESPLLVTTVAGSAPTCDNIHAFLYEVDAFLATESRDATRAKAFLSHALSDKLGADRITRLAAKMPPVPSAAPAPAEGGARSLTVITDEVLDDLEFNLDAYSARAFFAAFTDLYEKRDRFPELYARAQEINLLITRKK